MIYTYISLWSILISTWQQYLSSLHCHMTVFETCVSVNQYLPEFSRWGTDSRSCWMKLLLHLFANTNNPWHFYFFRQMDLRFKGLFWFMFSWLSFIPMKLYIFVLLYTDNCIAWSLLLPGMISHQYCQYFVLYVLSMFFSITYLKYINPLNVVFFGSCWCVASFSICSMVAAKNTI